MMPCILVIDDDGQTRTLFRQLLERAGYEVVVACTGNEGVHTCQTRHVDVVITDLLMPEPNGFATLRALQTLTPAVKCIAMSGGAYAGTADLLRVAEQWGAKRVLRKPVPLQEILAAVQGILAEDKDPCAERA